jgi:psiF repeat
MNTLLAAIVALAFAAGTSSLAVAADDKKLTPQQERMKACNAQASSKKGDERKAFMSECLKDEGAAGPRSRSRVTTARHS